MKTVIGDISDKISGTLQTNEVVFAGLFGSYAKGTATATSDYDFLVEFSPQKNTHYFTLLLLKKN